LTAIYCILRAESSNRRLEHEPPAAA
jgi:hypothetical protein